MNVIMRGISRRQFLQGVSGSAGALGLLACESGPAPYLPPPVETETAAPVPTRRPEVEAVEVELTIGSFSDESLASLQESIGRFHSYYPGIRIRVDTERQGDSLWNRLFILFVSGEGIDVAQFPGSHLRLVDGGSGLFSSLDGFAKADNSFDLKPYYSRIVEFYSTPGDRLWCLPWSYATEALYYNKQHFAKAGIPTPKLNWTWEDVRDTARTLTKDSDNDDESNLWGVELRLHNLDYVLRSFGGGFPIEEVENTDEIRAGNIAALQFVADLVLEDGVHPFPRLGLNDGFAQGKVSMSFLPESATARLNTVEGLDYDVAPIPQGPAGSVTSFAASGVAMGGWYCDHPDHSWEVVKWFAHADYGDWGVARALLFPEGLPTALRAANQFCWTNYHDRPENRHLFLQNFETAMVPFSDSPWWPRLSGYGWFGGSSKWRDIEDVFHGSATVEGVMKELEESWEHERLEMAEVLARSVSDDWGCFRASSWSR